MAVLGGHLDVVKYILNHNPDLVNLVDHDGWTPLLCAMRQDDNWGAETTQLADIVRELLRCGASRLVEGKGAFRSWTAYQLAQVFSYGHSEDIVSLATPSEDELQSMGRSERQWWITSIKYDRMVCRERMRFIGGKGTLLRCEACLLVRFCMDYLQGHTY